MYVNYNWFKFNQIMEKFHGTYSVHTVYNLIQMTLPHLIFAGRYLKIYLLNQKVLKFSFLPLVLLRGGGVDSIQLF